MKQHVRWMSGYKNMQNYTGVVDKMLDRMHRQPAPGAGDDVPVVHRMSHVVERRPMDHPVDPIKMY